MINTTAEIQQYVSVDINLQQKSVLPYIEQGKNQIERLLGKVQYEALNEWYNDIYQGDHEDATEYAALLPYVQRPLANFAIFYGLSALNVVVGPAGIGVVSNQNIAPASKDRTEALKKDLLDAAYDAMESLLVFLEENKDDYPFWEYSDAFADQYDVLITSARKFDEIIRIERSRLKYLEWRPVMKDVEFLTIAPQISGAYMSELKTKQEAETLTDADKEVLPYLQRALAYLTRFRSSNDENDKNIGTHYLMSAKAILDETPDNYPTYKASGVFKSPEKDYRRIKNESDSKFMWFGM
jgi:hypothetical protein